MRKRVSDLEKTSKAIEEESLALKRKLKEMSEETKMNKLTLSKSSGDLKAAAQQTPADKLRKYLEEKELHIFKKVTVFLRRSGKSKASKRRFACPWRAAFRKTGARSAAN